MLALAALTSTAAAQTPAQRVATLLADLTSDDPTARGAAALGLQTIRGRGVVPPLIGAATTGSPVVRPHAVRALGRLRAAEAVTPLLALLTDSEGTLHEDARAALARIGHPAIAPLLTLISRTELGNRDDFAVHLRVDPRREAALTLAAIGDPAVTPVVRALALAAPDPRGYLLSALAGMDAVRASDALAAQGRHPEPDRRWEAVYAAYESLTDLIRPDQRRFERAKVMAPRLAMVIASGLGDASPVVRATALQSVARLMEQNAVFVDWDFYVDLSFDLGAIVDNVAHGDATVRETAIGVLMKAGLSHASRVRLEVLGQSSDPVISEAALRAIDWAMHVPDVHEAAADATRNVEARVEAVFALRDIDCSNQDALVALLTDPALEVRVAAADSLDCQAGANDGPLIQTLLAALRDPEPEMRGAILATLTTIVQPDPPIESGLDAFMALLSDDDPGMRAAVVGAARALGITAVIPHLRSMATDARTRDAAIDALAGFHTQAAVSALMALAADPEPALRVAALYRLARVRGEVEDAAITAAVLAAVRDADAVVRVAGLRTLSGHEIPEALDVIERALSDSDPLVRRAAVQALADARGPRAARLQAALSRSEDPDSRVVAVAGLTAIADIPARQRLVELLADASDDVAFRAATALTGLKEPRAVDGLVLRLRHRFDYVRAAAASALGQIGDPRAIAPLIRSLTDDDTDVADAAARALGALRARAAVPDLIEAVRLQGLRGAVAALGLIGDSRAFAPLMAAARDRRIGEEPVIAALGSLRDRRATAWLIERATSTQYAYTTQTAITALGTLRDSSAVDPLITLLAGKTSVAHSAAVALAEIGEPRALPPVMAAFTRALDASYGTGVDAFGTALARFGPPAVPLVSGLLASRPDERHMVLRALVRFGPEATPALVSALDLDDTSIRSSIAGELANREGPLVEQALLSRLDDDQVVQGGYRFFLKRLDERVVDRLSQVVRSSWQAEDYIKSGHPRLVEAGRAFLCPGRPGMCP